MAKRRKSQSSLPKVDSQHSAKLVTQLRSLRIQLGTAELARRMGIPAPSLRRLLGKGKTAGVPKTRMVFEVVQERIRRSRRKPENTRIELMSKDAVRAYENGTLDLEYMAIAKRHKCDPREVYSTGMGSPPQMGEVA